MKKIHLILCVLALCSGVISCNIKYEPQVSFGDKSYVNDYSALVKELANQTSAINARLDALNKLLESQLGSIKISIDENTGAIKALSGQLSDDMQDVIYAMLSGFNALSTVVEQTGGKIVYAINSSGEVIALHIDKNGSLISATIKTKVDELVKAINDQSLSISRRLDSLNVALSLGLARIEIKMGTTGSTIEAGFNLLNDAITGLDKDLLDGFTALKRQISATGDKLVYAVNKNGETIAFHLDCNGFMISANLAALSKNLADAINSQSISLADKLDSLTKAVEVGLLKVAVSAEHSGEEIEVKLSDINSTLGDIDRTILDGYTAVATKIDENGDKVVWAVGKNGETIALHLDQNGNLISAAVRESMDSLRDILNSLETTLKQKVDAMNEIIGRALGNIYVKMGEIGTKLNLQFTDMNDALDGINAKLLDGFTKLQSAINDKGNQIVLAINENGESLVAEVDESGKLISASVLEGDQKIVSAIAALDTDLGKKIDALGELLYNGLADIKVIINEGDKKISLSVDGVSDELKNLKSVLNASLGQISSDLQLLNTTEKSNGKKIVTALNANGEIIALHLDSNGKLISAQIKASVEDLIKVINSWKTSFEEKMDALNTLIEAGFATIHVDLGNLGAMLSVQYTQMNETLAGMNRNLLNGFTLVGKAIDDNGAAVALAVNTSGDKIVAELDESGKLISTNVLKGDKLIVAALVDFQSSFEAKMDALNDLLEDGLADITASIDDAARTIKLSVNGVSDEISSMKSLLSTAITGLNADLKLISQGIDLAGTRVVTALNANGETLTLKIDEMGKLLSVKLGEISTSLAALKDALADQNKGIADKLDLLNKAITDGLANIVVSINTQTGKIEVGMGELKTALDGIIDKLTVLNTTTGSNGDKIVTAINTNGEAIKLQIKASGELIDASLDENTTKLIAALTDPTTGLAAKFNALNTLLEKGLGEIKVAIGDLGTSINVDLGALKDLLGEKLDDIITGLTTLGTKVDGNGTTIANAITAEGGLIEAAIKANGDLIKVNLVDKLDEILQALKSHSTSAQAISDKLDAMNTTVNTGLGDISAKINAQTGELSTQLTNVNTNLSGANDYLSSMNAQLEGIKGNLTDGFKAIADSLGKVVVNLGKIKVAIDDNTEAILTLDDDLKLKLQNVADSVGRVGGKMVLAINTQGNAIALALGKDGDLVKAIDLGTAQLKNIWEALKVGTHRLDSILIAGNAISTSILNALGVAPGSTDTILAAIKANKVDLTEVINQLKTANRTLAELLAISDGVYLDINDTTYVVEDGKKVLKYKYIYVTATVREAASKSSEVDEGLMSLLVGKTMAEPTKEQIVPETAGTYGTGTIHYHCFWKKIEESKPFLKYVETVTDADNKTLLKMEKYYSESIWIVKIHDSCSRGHIYGILVNDARSINYYEKYYESYTTDPTVDYTQSKWWNKGYLNRNEKPDVTASLEYMGPIKVKFVSYDNTTDTFCANPSAKIYCMTAGSGNSISPEGKTITGENYPTSYSDKNNKDEGYWTDESNYSRLVSTQDVSLGRYAK